MKVLEQLDRRLLHTARTRMHARPIERTVQLYSSLGENGAFWIALALGGAASDRKRRGSWLRLAGAVPATLAANFFVKAAVRRKRPRLRGYKPLGHSASSLSFPSAHATTSFAAAHMLSEMAPDSRAGFFYLAGAMAVSRVYLGMHYPSDVVAGAALGTLIGKAFGPVVSDRRKSG